MLQEMLARSARSACGGRMRAWRAHAYGPAAAELRLERARVPPLRAPDHVLVRVRAASLNPIDLAMLGQHPYTTVRLLLPALPWKHSSFHIDSVHRRIRHTNIEFVTDAGGRRRCRVSAGGGA